MITSGKATYRSDVDSVILVEGNALSFLEELDLHGQGVSAGSVHHPSVDSVSHSAVGLGVGLVRSEEESFILSKDEDLLDSTFEGFTGLEEEGVGACLKDLLSELVLSVLAHRVQDIAELVFSEDGSVSGVDVLLIHVVDVDRSLLRGHKPLLSGLSLLSIDVHEGLLGLEENGCGIIENSSGHHLADGFIDAWDVEADVSDEPLISCLSVVSL
jgi:hypothetical protein